MPADPALVLWDVDHTLVNMAGVSQLIYERAFAAMTGRVLERVADMAGRTEWAIAADTLRLAGFADPEPMLPAFFEALRAAAAEMTEQMRARGRALPGARETVAAFGADGVSQTLVTGNLRALAGMKLAAVGLTDHLDLAVGGYGEDSADRAELVRSAIARAEAAYGLDFPRQRVVVVGDTVHDVRGARDAGARAVAVATGRPSFAALAAAGPDALLADLTDPVAVRAAVFGTVG